MKTADLVAFLAKGAGPAPRAAVARRLAPVIGVSLLTSSAASLGLLGIVPSTMWAGSALWTKLAYAAALAAAAAWLTGRLARPAAPPAASVVAVVAVVATMALAGGLALLARPPAEQKGYLMGLSAANCPWLIFALSLPALAGIMWAMRSLAPTRPLQAGLAAGLLAGAIGAAAYALSCDEVSIAFIAVWYSLGIALSGFAGGALGPRLLRW